MELFTFTFVSDEGPAVWNLFLTREDADKRFNEAIVAGKNFFISYHCASVGGLVNAWFRQ